MQNFWQVEMIYSSVNSKLTEISYLEQRLEKFKDSSLEIPYQGI